jgi:feruloyl esterase
LSDQQLFTKAILQACDGLDGTVDGVIDNLPACPAKFDPATYVFTDTQQPLQCTGPKQSTCLSAAQVSAVKQINQGPRTSSGETIEAPAGAVAHDHPDNTVLGYAYDGGYMAPTGIPARKIGTATTPPGDFGQGASQIGWAWLSPPDPTFDILGFNFDTDTDLLVKSSPVATQFGLAGHQAVHQPQRQNYLVSWVERSRPTGAWDNQILQRTGGSTPRPARGRRVLPVLPDPEYGSLHGRTRD